MWRIRLVEISTGKVLRRVTVTSPTAMERVKEEMHINLDKENYKIETEEFEYGRDSN